MTSSIDLSCGVCFNAYNRSERLPIVLYCGHTYCNICVNEITTKNVVTLRIPCPECRKETVAYEPLAPNFFVVRLLPEEEVHTAKAAAASSLKGKEKETAIHAAEAGGRRREKKPKLEVHTAKAAATVLRLKPDEPSQQDTAELIEFLRLHK